MAVVPADQVRPLRLFVALVAVVAAAGGFAGGRATAPVPPAADLPIVHVPAAAALALALPAPAAVELEPEPASAAPAVVEQPAAASSEPEQPAVAAAAPASQPKLDEGKPQAKAKRRPDKDAPAKKPRASAPKKTLLPSCEVIQRENERMTLAEKLAAFRRATPEQIAYGRRCLGM